MFVIGGAFSEVSSELGSPPQRFVREITIPADGTVNLFVNAGVATIGQDVGIARHSVLIQIYVMLQYQ